MGGEPCLPADVDWPTWEGHGPLSFIASINCGAISRARVHTILPGSGTLLFFYFDGQVDNGKTWVHPRDPEIGSGSRVLYVPASTPTAPRPTPGELRAYRHVRLQAETGVKIPQITDSWIYPRLGLDYGTVSTDPMYVDFQEAVWNLRQTYHQVGGTPASIQGDVALEVADIKPEWDMEQLDPDNPHFDDILEELSQWELLAQFASDRDAGMMWGDGGMLYWLIDPYDAELRDFDEARFTWQCY